MREARFPGGGGFNAAAASRTLMPQPRMTLEASFASCGVASSPAARAALAEREGLREARFPGGGCFDRPPAARAPHADRRPLSQASLVATFGLHAPALGGIGGEGGIARGALSHVGSGFNAAAASRPLMPQPRMTLEASFASSGVVASPAARAALAEREGLREARFPGGGGFNAAAASRPLIS